MSNISKIWLNKVADELVIELLRAVVPVLEQIGIDYFVVGAFARDIELLSRGYDASPSRKTKDIDMAVMVGSTKEYESLKKAIVELSEFKASEDEPYRVLFRNAYEVDFLPFGGIVDEKGRVELNSSKTFVLNMPGFDAVQPFVGTVETEEGLILKVSSLSGIILLKLLAWQDRPEREKDIHDIAYILKHFYILHIAEMVEMDSDLLYLYEESDVVFTESISARYIGRQMGIMTKTSPLLLNRLLQLLEEQSKGYSMSRLISAQNIEDNQRIIKALYDGIKDEIPHE